MAESSQCAQCGAVVPSDAPQGLCPNCVLAAGFPTDGVALDGLKSDCTTTLGAEFAPPTPAELTPHFPDLEIIELLGRGGMGVVYKARQKRLDRLVALKILAPRIAQDPTFAERFAREARALAMLSHPQIVAVHDFGQTSFSLKLSDGADDANTSPDGGGECSLYYFVMEYVDGVNLRRLLEAENISPQQALEIVPQICTALQFAHDAGVVHRDIKPENILLDKQGRVKIADFGIAKLMGRESKGAKAKGNSPHLCEAPAPPSSDLTIAGQVIGTPQYMAPEQIEHPQEVDHRADIYSLGVVFYQMLTGELPTGRFAPPSKKVYIDVRLDEVVLRAMEKEPERRYQQVSEVKTQVENIATTPHVSGESAKQSPPDTNGNLSASGSCTCRDWRSWGMGLGVRDGKKTINWSGLILGWAFLFACCCVFWLLQPNREAHIETFLIFAVASAVTTSFFAWVQSHRPIEQLPKLDLSRLQKPHAEVDVSAIEEARRQVKGPAIGLLVTGMLNCLAIPAIAVIANTRMVSMEPGAAAPVRNGYDIFWMIATIIAFFLATLFPGVMMIVAAVKMKRLRAYWLAVVASVLAVVLSPAGFFIGLPIGIWALVVLSQRKVRAAFGRRRQMNRPVLKALATIVIVLAVAIGACIALREALYYQQLSQIPQRARIASIERKYHSQLEKMAEFTFDYDRYAGHGMPEGEEIAQLFADPAIVKATVHSGNPPGSGFGVKSSEPSNVSSSCSFYSSPSIGNPVLNLWKSGNQQFIEYCACLLDRKGVERSYTILFDPLKMDEIDDGIHRPETTLPSAKIEQPGAALDVAKHPGGPWIAKLPQGNIELVAISYHPSKGQPWWQPDGLQIADGSFETEGTKYFPNRPGYEFVIRPHGLDHPSLGKWQFEAGGSLSRSCTTTGELTGKYVELTGNYTVVCLTSLSKSIRTCTLRIGVAHGPWKTLSSCDQNGFSETVADLTKGNWFPRPVETANKSTVVSVAYVTALASNQQLRLVAIDSNGKEITQRGLGTSTQKDYSQMVATFAKLPLETIKEFRFQARPYEWVEFRNVALRPGQKTAMQNVAPDMSEQEQQKAPPRQLSDLKKVNFVIGPHAFADGDKIEIEEVRSELGTLAKGDTVTVKGTYTLASQSKARLGFYVTQGSKEPPDNSPALDNPIMPIQAGSGSFELKHRITCNGHLHISFYPAPFGGSFGYIYFGTKSQMKKIAHWNIDKSNTSSTRTLAAEAGRQSSEKPTEDMQTYLQKTKELVSQHKDKEALERFIWFHEHALEYEPSMSAVRLSFALSAWKKLADVYPPAMEALVDIRDWNTMQLKQGQGNADLFHDVAAINSTLGENAKTLRLFRELDKSNAAFAGKCWHYAKDVVYAAKEYDLAGKYVKHPLKDFELEKTAYVLKIGMYSDPRFEKPEFKQWNESSFAKGCLRLIELATFNGDKKTAEEIRKRAESVVGHPIDVPKPAAKSAKAIGGDGSGKK